MNAPARSPFAPPLHPLPVINTARDHDVTMRRPFGGWPGETNTVQSLAFYREGDVLHIVSYCSQHWTRNVWISRSDFGLVVYDKAKDETHGWVNAAGALRLLREFRKYHRDCKDEQIDAETAMVEGD